MKKDNMFISLKKTFQYMNKSIFAIICALLLSAVSAILTIIGPDVIGEMTSLMQNGLFSNIDLHAISKLGIFLACIYILGAVFQYAVHFIMATVTLNTSRRLREELSQKINRVPMSYFNTTSQGDVLSRITNDVSTMQQGLTNSLPNIIAATAQFLGCLIMMFVTEARLAACVVVITFVGMAILMVVMKRSQKYFVARQENLGKLNGYIEEMYSGHEVVRSSRACNKVKRDFAQLNLAVYDANWRSQFLSGIMQPLMTVIGNIGYVAVCVVGSVLVIKNGMDFGIIVSFILYVRLFTSPLTQIAQGLTNIQTASASAKRVFDFLDAEEMSDESGKEEYNGTPRGNVEFKNVSFSYPDDPSKPIIKNFSASIKAGAKVAIVGPTGAGKTTVVNLLMRFFEVNGGYISVDGRKTFDIRREDIHKMFGMVLQDTWLFEGTVRENLVYNMTSITDSDLERVCKACGIYRFIHSLPQGFDTVLNESTSISAGQKQLMTIARAMLQDAPMLILDEATSSVDTRTEAIIQRAMDELTRGRTSFVIAHRLSTIKNADLILVMRDGDIIESGTHNDLLALGGAYSELYNSQFENS